MGWDGGMGKFLIREKKIIEIVVDVYIFGRRLDCIVMKERDRERF